MKTENHILIKKSHAVYTINYHIIQCVKYRKRVFCFRDINLFLKRRVAKVCRSWDVRLVAIGIDLNHFHILIEVRDGFNISKFMNNLKSSTSKSLRNRYSFLKKAISTNLWSPSYCAISCGVVAMPVVENYVNSQGSVTTKR